MVYLKTRFPQFPEYTIFISLYRGVQKEVIEGVKTGLISGDEKYDFCFLNTTHIISVEQLYNAVHKALLNDLNESKVAKTLNTEIILNLSPINNIGDALRRFGINEHQSDVIVIKVLPSSTSGADLGKLNSSVIELLGGSSVSNPTLNDDIIFSDLVDMKKLKKVYKLNDAKIDFSQSIQNDISKLVIACCHLRGC